MRSHTAQLALIALLVALIVAVFGARAFGPASQGVVAQSRVTSTPTVGPPPTHSPQAAPASTASQQLGPPPGVRLTDPFGSQPIPTMAPNHAPLPGPAPTGPNTAPQDHMKLPIRTFPVPSPIPSRYQISSIPVPRRPNPGHDPKSSDNTPKIVPTEVP